MPAFLSTSIAQTGHSSRQRPQPLQHSSSTRTLLPNLSPKQLDRASRAPTGHRRLQYPRPPFVRKPRPTSSPRFTTPALRKKKAMSASENGAPKSRGTVAKLQ